MIPETLVPTSMLLCSDAFSSIGLLSPMAEDGFLKD